LLQRPVLALAQSPHLLHVCISYNQWRFQGGRAGGGRPPIDWMHLEMSEKFARNALFLHTIFEN